MTEHEWLAVREIDPILTRLSAQGMPLRQFRLWGCAVARRLVWNHLVDEASSRAIEIAESYADGQVDETALVRAHEEAREVYNGISLIETVANPGWAASRLAAILTRPNTEFNYSTVIILSRITHAPWMPGPASDGGWIHRGEPTLRNEAEAVQVEVLREIVGENPFRPVILPYSVRTWHDGLALAMAEGILTGRDWDHLPVLADALDDAGCEATALLEHLRDPGPHFVGCWGLDTILNRPRWQPPAVA